MKKLTALLIIALFFAEVSAMGIPRDSVRVQVSGTRRYVIHRVEKGQGLLAIARRYNTDIKLIMEANPEGGARLNIGDEIRIPLGAADTVVSPTSSRQKDRPDGVRKEQVIKKTDSASKIDEAHANADAKETEFSGRHVVAPGETLARIAQKYKVTVSDIVKWNGLRESRIEVGQELSVSSLNARKPYEGWNKPGASVLLAEPVNLLTTPGLVEQTGFANIAQAEEVLHTTAPAGTLLLITNLDNGKQCYVRVSGNFDSGRDVILQVSARTKQKLQAEGELVRIALRYTIPSESTR